MKPAFILLLAVVFLFQVPMGISRQGMPAPPDDLSFRHLQLKNPSLPGGGGDAQETDARIRTLLSSLPLSFVENKGQVNDRVRYYAKISNGKVYFTGEEIVYQFLLGDEERARPQRPPVPTEIESPAGWASAGGSSPIREEAIRVRFVGANQETRLEAAGEREAKFSYFRGKDPRKWASGARSYQKVAYRELYPGIDLVVSGREGRMKNEYVVRPGGEPAAIRVKYEGAKGLEVNEKGQLVIRTSEGMLIEDVPLSYQIIKGKKKGVETRYELSADDSVQFHVGRYSTKADLIIDPLIYSTFLGGTEYELAYGIAVDGSANVYVAGYTVSSDFPTTSGAYDTSYNGGWDVFIAKVNSFGSDLLYSTFLGGTNSDSVFGIAVDGSGNVYVAGRTFSSDFPTTSGAYDTSYNGADDVFIAKVSSSGSDLLYSTFLGGTGSDYGNGIAIDGSGNAYLTGETNSSDFPTTSGAYDTGFNGGTTDAFVTELNSSGSDLLYSTFLGGTGDDVAYGIAVDGSGSVYVAGKTASSDFPTTSGAYDTSYNGGGDVFIANVNSSGSGLLYSTFLGGASEDVADGGIAVDGSGNAYVTGYTLSFDFPATFDAYNTDHNGGTEDIFITKVNSSGSGLLYSTFLGGTSFDHAFGIAVDGSGNVYVAGYTFSSDFPTTSGAYDPGLSGEYDAFVAKLYPASPDIRQPIAAINFGNVNVGTFSDQTTTIYNDGEFALTINSITRISGGSEFTYTDPTCPFSISAGGSQNVTVRFSASSAGAKSAVFNVSSDDPDEPDVPFNVSGTGVVAGESVSAPGTLAGQTNGYLNTSYTYTTGGSVSSFGHDVQYYFDWGDGTNTGWLSVGTLSAQKSWSSANTFAVKAKARCATDTAVESPWSASLSVSISAQDYGNSPSNYKVLPECIWASATGGGTWLSEVQITDVTGGSVVSAYFDYGGGNRRGPFTLWTSPGANRNVKYSNILSSIDALDSEAFTYYGRVGAVEFMTQDAAHKIQVTARTRNGNYSKTFPGLNLTEANTADTARRMMIQDFVNNATYRSNCGFFNPTADAVTLELKLIDENGSQIGSTVIRTLAGHDFQAFSPFNQAGVPYPRYSYDNVVLWITPTSGSGKVMVFGASANNASNDPAAHIGVQYQ